MNQQSRNRLRLTTLLFTPATRSDRYQKAAAVGADMLILDLEDAVAQNDKQDAREKLLREMPQLTPLNTVCAIRINALDTLAGVKDILALAGSPSRPRVVLLPKTESAAHLRILDRLLSEASCDCSVIGLIESARGVAQVAEIARASKRLVALMLGAADLAADYGCGPDAHNLDAARAALIQACALAGLSGIDSPFFDLDDSEGLRRATLHAVDMGFAGKAAIHPKQIETIRSAFTPSAQTLEHARAVLVASQGGVGSVNGRMVDEAVARRARQILSAAGEL